MSNRKVLLDTETTGLDASVHRIINIAAVELIDNVPTGNFRQWYLNPDRESDPRALEIHGLTTEFLRDKPRFGEVSEELSQFLAGDPLVIHNAEFDVRFVNTERRRLALSPLPNRSVCTKCQSQKKYGGRSGHKLDDLVRRFGIEDLRGRFGVHGALIDCLLLVNVYRALNDAPLVSLDLAKFGIEPLETISVTSEGGGSASGEVVTTISGADTADPAAIFGAGSEGASAGSE